MRPVSLVAIALVAASFVVVLSPTASAFECAQYKDPLTGEPKSTCDVSAICQGKLGQMLTICHAT